MRGFLPECLSSAIALTHGQLLPGETPLRPCIIIAFVKILFLCGRELSYPRNKLIYKLLSSSHSVDFIGQKTGHARIIPNALLSFIRSIPAILSKKYDLIYAGFWGNLSVILTGRLSRVPILFDAFVSTYDTICFDRGLAGPKSLTGKLAYWLDQAACSRATRVITDTQAHQRYFADTFGTPVEKITTLYVGCDEDLFQPRSSGMESDLILFHGSLLKLHGFDVILKAARLVEQADPSLKFKFICPTDKYRETMREISTGAPGNIQQIPPVPLEDLPAHIADATLCLGGHFGRTDKAGRTIPGKVFQYMAMGKAIIAGDSPANHELLTHDQDAWFCRMNDPAALADAILSLMHDRRRLDKLGRSAYHTFTMKASRKCLLDALAEALPPLQSSSQ